LGSAALGVGLSLSRGRSTGFCSRPRVRVAFVGHFGFELLLLVALQSGVVVPLQLIVGSLQIGGRALEFRHVLLLGGQLSYLAPKRRQLFGLHCRPGGTSSAASMVHGPVGGLPFRSCDPVERSFLERCAAVTSC
jgi:hypothetical protein